MTERTHVFTSWGLEEWAKELADQDHPFAEVISQYASAWEADVDDCRSYYYEQGARDAKDE